MNKNHHLTRDRQLIGEMRLITGEYGIKLLATYQIGCEPHDVRMRLPLHYSARQLHSGGILKYHILTGEIEPQTRRLCKTKYAFQGDHFQGSPNLF